MATRDLIGIVGAGVGAFVGAAFGNPVLGAQIGFTVGSGVGSIVDPVTIKGPSLNDAPVQTSRDGVPITMFWGLQYGHGNLLQKNPEVITTETSSQGKGGGPEVEEQRRYRTFAIGIGNTTVGPISEVTRIWENNRVVYDVRAEPAIPADETAKYAEGIRIYLGTEDQLPDPDLEAHWGVDETPAYRGVAYIVWVNKDLTDMGGAIPSFAFEVNGSKDRTITSKPYPIEAVDGMQATLTVQDPIYQVTLHEGLTATNTPQDGTLRALLHGFSFPAEGLEATNTPQDGTLRTLLHQYSIPAEGLEATITPQDGTLEVRLISYTFDPVEGLAATITPKDGTLI